MDGLLDDRPDLEEEIAPNLPQPRPVASSSNSTTFYFEPTTLSRRSIFHATYFSVSIAQHVETLKSLTHTETLSLKLHFEGGLPEHRFREEIRDFRPLLGLAQLSRLDIKFISVHINNRSDPQDFCHVGKAVGDVMRQLVQLKHRSLDAVTLLQHCRDSASWSISSLASPVPHSSQVSTGSAVTSALIECSLHRCNLSGIGSLFGLEHLQLLGSDLACGGASTQLSFLTKLVNLKTLVVLFGMAKEAVF